MPAKLGAFEVRTLEELHARPAQLPDWQETTDEETVVIAVTRFTLNNGSLRGERTGNVWLVRSPIQTRLHMMPCEASGAGGADRTGRFYLGRMITDLIKYGYRVHVDPVEVPVSVLEFALLTGEIEPESLEPLETAS